MATMAFRRISTPTDHKNADSVIKNKFQEGEWRRAREIFDTVAHSAGEEFALSILETSTGITDFSSKCGEALRGKEPSSSAAREEKDFQRAAMEIIRSKFNHEHWERALIIASDFAASSSEREALETLSRISGYRSLVALHTHIRRGGKLPSILPDLPDDFLRNVQATILRKAEIFTSPEKRRKAVLFALRAARCYGWKHAYNLLGELTNRDKLTFPAIRSRLMLVHSISPYFDKYARAIAISTGQFEHNQLDEAVSLCRQFVERTGREEDAFQALEAAGNINSLKQSLTLRRRAANSSGINVAHLDNRLPSSEQASKMVNSIEINKRVLAVLSLKPAFARIDHERTAAFVIRLCALFRVQEVFSILEESVNFANFVALASSKIENRTTEPTLHIVDAASQESDDPAFTTAPEQEKSTTILRNRRMRLVGELLGAIPQYYQKESDAKALIIQQLELCDFRDRGHNEVIAMVLKARGPNDLAIKINYWLLEQLKDRRGFQLGIVPYDEVEVHDIVAGDFSNVEVLLPVALGMDPDSLDFNPNEMRKFAKRLGIIGKFFSNDPLTMAYLELIGERFGTVGKKGSSLIVMAKRRKQNIMKVRRQVEEAVLSITDIARTIDFEQPYYDIKLPRPNVEKIAEILGWEEQAVLAYFPVPPTDERLSISDLKKLINGNDDDLKRTLEFAAHLGILDDIWLEDKVARIGVRILELSYGLNGEHVYNDIQIAQILIEEKRTGKRFSSDAIASLRKYALEKVREEIADMGSTPAVASSSEAAEAKPVETEIFTFQPNSSRPDADLGISSAEILAGTIAKPASDQRTGAIRAILSLSSLRPSLRILRSSDPQGFIVINQLYGITDAAVLERHEVARLISDGKNTVDESIVNEIELRALKALCFILRKG